MRVVPSVVLAQVGPHRGLPIGPDGDGPPPAGRREGTPGQEGADALPAAEPGQERRHLQDHLVGQQPGQPGHVGVHERRDVPVGQFPLPLVRRARGAVPVRRDLLQLGAGPLQGTVHGRGRDLQQVRDLGGAPRQHVPQDQHGALPGRKMLQRRDEREPDALPRRDDRRRIGRAARVHAGPAQASPVQASTEQRVRERLQPGDLQVPAGRMPRRLGQAARAGEVRGQRPPAAALQRGQARVGGDPVQPRPHRGPSGIKIPVGPPGPQHGLLHQVFGVVYRAQHPVAVRQQLPAERIRLPHELVADRSIRAHAHSFRHHRFRFMTA
jgi:hypothetical protein